MKQKVWILLAVLLLLVATTLVRERFEATATIKAPPYDAAEKERIWNMIPFADRHTLINGMIEKLGNQATPELLSANLKDGISSLVGKMYTTVYSPAKTPITEAQITEFIQQNAPPTSDANQVMIMKRLLTSYFLDQSAPAKSNPFQGAAMMPPGSLGEVATPQPATNSNRFEGAAMVPGKLVDDGPVTVLSGGPTQPPLSMVSGTTTGGTSTTSLGPTSGTTGASGQKIFGPVFTARGEGGNPGHSGDSTKTNQYPELMGGRAGAASTKIAGAGIVPPSKNWTLTKDGSLPSWESLGATEMSKYFPTSRTPGDMDLIPDPYRVSRNFSTASYSSKTEPAPFLTDFSAFLK